MHSLYLPTIASAVHSSRVQSYEQHSVHGDQWLVLAEGVVKRNVLRVSSFLMNCGVELSGGRNSRGSGGGPKYSVSGCYNPLEKILRGP